MRGFLLETHVDARARKGRGGGEEKEWKRREREEANVCTIHGRALRVFSVPNETVVILWSASALERYTLERKGSVGYRPLFLAPVLLFFPRHSELNLEQRSNVM